MTDFTPGSPAWADLTTSDLDGAQRFYGALFGWTFEPTQDDFGGYVNVLSGSDRVAGLMAKDASMQEYPDFWSLYLASDDAAATVSAAEAAGGAVHMPATEVGDLGRMAMITDADGASLGVWEAGAHTGFGRLASPGAPCWFELSTRGFAGVGDFYGKTFGLTLHPMADTDEFRYSTFGEPGSPTAGVMDAAAFLPEGVPSHWQIYWGVEDTDAAVELAEKNGGTLLLPAEDSPYGRVAALMDPFGAAFKVVQAV
ncbi:VOC family protein [Falsarthrobacter nasiphocae]|uniref:Enzyme related to lactoylglutathione lyase n=1 Tax=Falsarthrobacter nasiphocae TaxID=189863 RepID=A0AAE4C6I2_9MICC|nr:VOC family protein [Falsarthrobacter nasiphocae]MDR6892192.1 putative enzyme related to lactoylglutathione lyase [Falsarthrobacter nasiphocae]